MKKLDKDVRRCMKRSRLCWVATEITRRDHSTATRVRCLYIFSNDSYLLFVVPHFSSSCALVSLVFRTQALRPSLHIAARRPFVSVWLVLSAGEEPLDLVDFFSVCNGLAPLHLSHLQSRVHHIPCKVLWPSRRFSLLWGLHTLRGSLIGRQLKRNVCPPCSTSSPGIELSWFTGRDKILQPICECVTDWTKKAPP